ncbi:MAG: hypothetical protein QME35_01005 [Thermoanaerobacteraceae bacterium]|nr:hypothetical protein [Thermoanaerobacteraceae bacterium]
MADLTKDVISSMEELINKVQSVISSRVVANNNEITEIHVLSDSSRSAKQIARDVQSALMAEFDIEVNYKIISIAQIDTGGRVYNDSRFIFSNCSYMTNGIRAEAAVTLIRGSESYEGFSSGINTKRMKYRLLVNAVLDCIAKVITNEHILLLEDVDIFQIAKTNVVVVALTHVTHQYEELLIGSCLVKKDEGEAVVKAALDALNRRITAILNS